MGFTNHLGHRILESQCIYNGLVDVMFVASLVEIDIEVFLLTLKLDRQTDICKKANYFLKENMLNRPKKNVYHYSLYVRK